MINCKDCKFYSKDTGLCILFSCPSYLKEVLPDYVTKPKSNLAEIVGYTEAHTFVGFEVALNFGCVAGEKETEE